MGAFHDGHLSLMRQARSECESVVVSLFVNPTQFNSDADLAGYPRDEKRDAEMAQSAGVDVLFAPSEAEMYSRRTTQVVVDEVSRRWEGEHRPGHFAGVATIVCKLFNIVRPSIAYFGKKDLQQCAVVARMVEDLNIPTELRFCETLREADGLAMSSRNALLSEEARTRAPRLFQALSETRRMALSGEPIEKALSHGLNRLVSAGFEVDYFAAVDRSTLEPIESLGSESSLVAAATIGNIRLIDNVEI